MATTHKAMENKKSGNTGTAKRSTTAQRDDKRETTTATAGQGHHSQKDQSKK